MSNEKYTLGYAKIIIAKFMELDSIEVGYADSEEETEWQRNNEEWMNRVGLTQVGRYFVNVKENKWHEWDDVKYDSSWDWLVPVIKKIKGMHFDILQKTLILDYMNAAGAMNSGWLSLDINKAHKGVYEFLTWYSQQKQKDGTER